MGCDNLATKSDIKSAESNIINELNNKARAISIQISQGFTQVVSQISEVLNEIRRLKNAIDEIGRAISVIIPIINNILNVVIAIRAEIQFILQAIFNLSVTINAKLEAILNAIFNIQVTINNIINITNNLTINFNNTNNEINNIKNEVNNVRNYFNNVTNQYNNLTNNIQNVSNNIQNVNNNVQNISNNITNINNTTINNIGGGGNCNNFNFNFDPLFQIINNINTDINFIKNNCIGGGGGNSDDPLLTGEIEMKEIECIDCEGQIVCTPEQLEQPYEITPFLVTGVPEALTELDNKLVNILKKDCEKEAKTEKLVKVKVLAEPSKSKVYYGDTEDETIVFAGWVAFTKNVKNGAGQSDVIRLGAELPIRRMEQYFYMPDYADGYSVQPLHNAQLQHEIVTLENGKITN